MSDWESTTVGEVATGFLSGGTPTTKRPEYWEGTTPWITSKWLGDRLELAGGEKLISEEAVKKTSTKIVPKNSIIFATRVGVGKVGINRVDLAINQDLAGILINDESHDLKFLAYQLMTDPIQQYVAMNRRGATIKGITRDCLKQIRLNIPPLSEQKKIAHILSTVQRAIEAQERIIQTATELKKALMYKLFTECLHNEPQKQTEIGPIPKSWNVSTLGQITTMRTGGTPSRKKKRFWEGGTIPWVKTGEVNYRTITTTEESITRLGLVESNAKLLPKGTLVLAMYGQGITRGRVGLLGIDAATNQACAALTPNDETQVSTEYLYFYLEYFYEELRSRGHGANQKNLSMTLLKLFPVAFPDSGCQGEIVTALRNADTKIALAEVRRNSFQDLFHTLLHELITAKIRVVALNLDNKLS